MMEPSRARYCRDRSWSAFSLFFSRDLGERETRPAPTLSQRPRSEMSAPFDQPLVDESRGTLAPASNTRHAIFPSSSAPTSTTTGRSRRSLSGSRPRAGRRRMAGSSTSTALATWSRRRLHQRRAGEHGHAIRDAEREGAAVPAARRDAAHGALPADANESLGPAARSVRKLLRRAHDADVEMLAGRR